MKIVAASRAAFLLTLMFALTGALAASSKEADAAMGQGGLEKIRVKGIELAYAKPGASLASYQRVKVDPIEVAFDKSWDPTRTGSSLKLSTQDRENIRTTIAEVVHEAFIKELQSKSSYQVVNEAGPGVLRVKASLVNVYLNAPDTGSGGRSKTFVTSAGSMTLLAELYDSASGELLARVADRREAGGLGRMQLASEMVNKDDARMIAAAWGRILRQALDKAHGIGAK